MQNHQLLVFLRLIKELSVNDQDYTSEVHLPSFLGTDEDWDNKLSSKGITGEGSVGTSRLLSTRSIDSAYTK